MKMNWSPNNLTIIEIYNKIKKDDLATRPFYQRRLVWTLKDKESFIDTILRGYPFPEVYFCQGEIDTCSLTAKEYVVDGQQRLTTIVDYIDGKLDFKSVKLFNDLLEDEKKDFLNYKVVIRNLGDISESEIKEIFNRLNKTDYTLNQTELLYAQYQGEYISTAKRIALNNTDFFELVFGEKSISRMVDLDFVLQIMTTIENGIYFSGNKEVETYVELYNEYYERSCDVEYLLSNIFDIFKALKLKKDSLFVKKAASFSLLVELSKQNKRPDEIDINNLREKIYKFEALLIENKEKDIETNSYAKFYNYLYQGTASKSARDFRGQMLREALLSL